MRSAERKAERTTQENAKNDTPSQPQQKISSNNHDGPEHIQTATLKDIQRYRYRQGTNLGGCYALEQWLTPSMYPPECQSSELAAVTASIKQDGLASTRAKWENYWRNFVKIEDSQWLVDEAHCRRS